MRLFPILALANYTYSLNSRKMYIMKKQFKLLLIGLLVLFFVNVSGGGSVDINSKEEVTAISYECRYDQCHAIAKSTERRCKHCVSQKGDLYCWQHN